MIKELSCNAQVYERTINPLRANPAKWSNTLKQFVGKLPTNCLVVFDHFVGLALKGLNDAFFEPYQTCLIKHKNAPSELSDRVINTLESAAKAGIAKKEKAHRVMASKLVTISQKIMRKVKIWVMLQILSMFYFYTAWKGLEISGSLTFSGDIILEHWLEQWVNPF